MGENEALMRRWFRDVWKAGGEKTVDELLSPCSTTSSTSTAVRWRCSATHTGNGLGFPATLKKVSFRGISWVEIRNGRIVRGWDSWNQGALLQSLLGPVAGVG